MMVGKVQIDYNALINKTVQAVVAAIVVSACVLIWKEATSVGSRIKASEDKQKATITVLDGMIKDLVKDIDAIKDFHSSMEESQGENVELIKRVIEMLEKEPSEEVVEMLNKKTESNVRNVYSFPDPSTVARPTPPPVPRMQDLPPMPDPPKYAVEQSINKMMEQQQTQPWKR